MNKAGRVRRKVRKKSAMRGMKHPRTWVRVQASEGANLDAVDVQAGDERTGI